MTFAFRLNMFAGLAAATLCLAPMTSNEATAQVFSQHGTHYSYYTPYGGGYSTGYYGGRAYGYTGYGQGQYGYGAPGVYVYQPSATYGHGVYYRGGLFPQSRTYFRSGPQYYSPYGYGGMY